MMPPVRRVSISYVLRLFLLFGVFSAVKNLKTDDEIESKNSSEASPPTTLFSKSHDEVTCPSGVECHKLGDPCIRCVYNRTCVYGAEVNVTCYATANCIGNTTFERSMLCRYCYQTDPSEHTCIRSANCNSVASPRVYYRTNCTVHSEVLCLGLRRFYKNLPCNWTGGYRWSTALLLSITLGGFGADRFYLGHWQEGIGKLFSFGGLGVWTLVDVVLIWLHYLGPADGSLYI